MPPLGRIRNIRLLPLLSFPRTPRAPVLKHSVPILALVLNSRSHGLSNFRGYCRAAYHIEIIA